MILSFSLCLLTNLKQKNVYRVAGASIYYEFVLSRWFAMPSQRDYIALALFTSLSELLQTFKERLQQMRDQLCPSVLNQLWMGITEELYKFVYI